jgi:hypothetical protein
MVQELIMGLDCIGFLFVLDIGIRFLMRKIKQNLNMTSLLFNL